MSINLQDLLWQRKFIRGNQQKMTHVLICMKLHSTRWIAFGILFCLYVHSRPPFQCLEDMMTSDYLNSPKKSCSDISDPCWIPQAANIINEQGLSALAQCDTSEKYLCMLNTLEAAKKNAKMNCVRSCRSEAYDIQMSSSGLEPFHYVRKSEHKNLKGVFTNIHYREDILGQLMLYQLIKASQHFTTIRLCSTTSMQLWQLWEDL